MTEILIDTAGWLGAGLLLLPYYLVSTAKVKGSSILLQLSNLSGSVFLMINSLYYGAIPSMFVNLIWVSIGFYSLFNISDQNWSKQESKHD